MTTYDQIAFANKYKSSAMQLMTVLHKTFEKQLPSIHKVRLNALMDATETAVRVNMLTLTGLGRNLFNQNKTRSNIKKMDRLLSNSHLHEESYSFYKMMASYLINENSYPWIHIDWSCICSVTNLYLLRASLSMPGRSIVIYEECHPKKNENHHPTHKAFLKRLKTLLPGSVKPVIVTDAGFRGLWFSEVLAMGWDFVGRVRNKNLMCFDHKTTWQFSQSLYEGASGRPKNLGHGVLTERLKVPAHFILFKGKKKNRCHPRRYDTNSKRYAKGHNEPWLLVTSLRSSDIAQQTIKIYHQRMRIEENFRDTKCTRYGFGLRESRTRSPERMKILLLIAALATFACWLAAIVTREMGAAADFQAHSSKFKTVLSSIYLGREALKKGINVGHEQFKTLLYLLFDLTREAKRETPIWY